MDSGRRRALIGAYAAFALFTALAGQFWRNLLSWYGWGAIALLVVIGAVVLVLSERPSWRFRSAPKSTLVFVGLATLSIAWSAYRFETLLGVLATAATTFVAVALALVLTWDRLTAALATAVKWILALSLIFEFVVAAFVRGPVLPNFFDPGDERVPQAFYWSRALLFEGGPIEGIVASRNILGMIALIGVLVFGTMLASGAMRRAQGIGWLVVAATVLVLTRSATVVLVSLVVLAALGFALWARRAGAGGRRPVYLAAAAALAASVAALVVFWGALLDLFGKSDDLTGRLDIWAAVTELAVQRPVLGWGWVSYWPPWTEPFAGLAVRNRVEYLQAHNAWLDVWLQLGLVGVVAFASIVVGALWRSWFLAVDRPRDDAGRVRPYTAASLLPLLLLVALVAQSFAESRILIEGGWLLLIAIAWSTKRRQWEPDPLPPGLPRRRLRERRAVGIAADR